MMIKVMVIKMTRWIPTAKLGGSFSIGASMGMYTNQLVTKKTTDDGEDNTKAESRGQQQASGEMFKSRPRVLLYLEIMPPSVKTSKQGQRWRLYM